MSTSSRLDWADGAKGTAVVAVVFTHVIGKHLTVAHWDLDHPTRNSLVWLADVGAPIRMPVFFVISGYFAVRALARSWRSLIDRKVMFFAYLYLVWLLIHTALLQFAPTFNTSVAHSPLDLLLQATVAPSNLWYLYALALYFALAKLGRPWPKVMLVGAALLAAAPALPFLGGNFPSIQWNLVWFLIGCYFPGLVSHWSHAVSPTRLVIVLAILGAALLLQVVIDQSFGWPDLLASGPGAASGIGAAVLFVRAFPRLGSAIATRIGRNTLPIYVLHLPLLALWHTVSQSSSGPVAAVVGLSRVTTLAYPLFLTAGLTTVALALNRALRLVMPFLFEKPAWLSMADGGARSDRIAPPLG